ncbi:MAG: hypothetical protein ACKO1F_05360, partial [Flammeovirgaceae bacterium]
MGISLSVHGQVITKSFEGTVPKASCPSIGIQYEVTRPSGFGGCDITWTITNGERQSQSGNTVTIKWNDTPGAIGKLKATFSNCGTGNEANNGKVTDEFQELILSVKDQAWGSYGNTVVVDYCVRNQVSLSMPRMYVQGTGGTSKVPLKEVIYSWTLPAGWREVGTGRTGTFNTVPNGINIEPIACSVPSAVTVKGIISVPPLGCGSAAASSNATINLNGALPVATVGAAIVFVARACSTAPVVFTATPSVALGCITNIAWNYPSGWSGPATTTSNTVTLTPNGTSAMQGTIRATFNTTCGSTFSGTYTVNIVRPVITGPNPVCSNGNYTLQNTAPNPSMVWSSSNSSGLAINNSGSFTIGNNFRGNVIISGSACGIAASPNSITVTVGTPAAPTDIVQGSGTLAIGATVPFSIIDPGNFSSTVPLTYNWDISGGYFNPLQGQEAYVTLTDSYLVLYASVSNGCGAGNMISRGFSVTGGCPPGEQCLMRAFPNPANSALNVSIKKAEAVQTEDAVLLLNQQSETVFSTKTSEK